MSPMAVQQFLCSVSFYSAWLLCGANWLLRQRREPADHDWGDVRTLSLGWYLAGDATDATSTRIPCRRSLMADNRNRRRRLRGSRRPAVSPWTTQAHRSPSSRPRSPCNDCFGGRAPHLWSPPEPVGAQPMDELVFLVPLRPARRQWQAAILHRRPSRSDHLPCSARPENRGASTNRARVSRSAQNCRRSIIPSTNTPGTRGSHLQNGLDVESGPAA